MSFVVSLIDERSRQETRAPLQWDRIKDILPGREGHVGGTAADNRPFVEAVLFRFRAGTSWRAIWPEVTKRSSDTH
jgi:hypothetical protein